MSNVGNFLVRNITYVIVLDVDLSVRLYADTPFKFYESMVYDTKHVFGYKFVEY